MKGFRFGKDEKVSEAAGNLSGNQSVVCKCKKEKDYPSAVQRLFQILTDLYNKHIFLLEGRFADGGRKTVLSQCELPYGRGYCHMGAS